VGIFNDLASKLLRKRDASTLYVSINELPNPRDWGIVEFSVGERLIFSEELDLAAPTVDAIEVLIGQHWEAIQSSGYKRIAYDNVAPWVQQKIEAKLALGRLK
jgi:hypothetical protein